MSDTLNPTEELSTQPEAPDQDLLNEAICPELSDDHFNLCGHKVQMKPLTLGNEMKLYKRLKNIAKDFAASAANGDWAILEKADDHQEAMLEIVSMICENDGKTVKLEDILNQREVNLTELLNIVFRFCRKIETLKGAVDFFTETLIPKAKELIQERALDVVDSIQREIDFNRTLRQQSSLNSSASDTPDGQLLTSSP